METRLKFIDGETYQGFRPYRGNLQPGDRLVLAILDGNPDTWIIDCEGGLGELKRYYREQYEWDVELKVFQQTLPSWFIVSEHMEEGDKIVPAINGPYWSRESAARELSVMETEEDFLNGHILPLNKP